MLGISTVESPGIGVDVGLGVGFVAGVGVLPGPLPGTRFGCIPGPRHGGWDFAGRGALPRPGRKRPAATPERRDTVPGRGCLRGCLLLLFLLLT